LGISINARERVTSLGTQNAKTPRNLLSTVAAESDIRGSKSRLNACEGL